MLLPQERKSENITISLDDQKEAISAIQSKTDPNSLRIKRFLGYKDLSRTPGSPLHEMIQRLEKIESLKNFDQIQVPEVVDAGVSFDLFNFPSDHPARSKSDTYYLDDTHILRTHTTIMWYYYLLNEAVQKRVEANEPLGVLSYGKVYRKDEIDRNHMNIFHQTDGMYLKPRSEGEITEEDLRGVLAEIAQAIYGKDIKYRFNKDQFPYTDPSLEMEIDKNGQWIEVLGGGLVRPVVLKNIGLDPEQYTGWAFGFGLERLAIISMELPDIRLLWSQDERVIKQLHLGQKFVPVSKYPPIPRDISFIVEDSKFVLNDYYDMIRDVGGDLVEEVTLLDKYVNEEKFGKGKTSYTFRVIYRSNDRTLEIKEIDPLQDKIYELTGSQFDAEVR